MFESGYKCKLCDKAGKNKKSLAMHLSRSHKGWNVEKYVLHFYHDDVIPSCSCGCGEEVKWNRIKGNFNDYINGHNHRFTSTNQPTFSEAQVQKRNASIRETYSNPKKSKEIKDKISMAVAEALSKDGVKAKLSKSLKATWAKPGHRKRMSKAQKKAWQENYEERYAKTFTPEFRSKVSASNRKRGLNNSSKREKLFFEALKANFKDASRDKWLQFEGTNKCFDAWIPSGKVLIEFDGVFWHGLDRASDFSFIQVRNMANDMFKNHLARDLGYSLIRLPMSDEVLQGLKAAQATDDLVKLSRYAHVAGKVAKDEMFRFTGDRHRLVSRDAILSERLESLGGIGTQAFRNAHVPDIVNFLYEYFLLHGFFTPECHDELDAILQKIRKVCCGLDSKTYTMSRRLGNKWLKSRFRSYWHAGQGPAVRCLDKAVIEQVVNYRVGINNSKQYTYEVGDLGKVRTTETFDITPSTIRRGFTARKLALSWFSPVTAYQIWRWVVGDIESPQVWDPSAGFGARAMGFAAAYPAGSYIGCEPATMTYSDLCELGKALDASSSFSGSTRFVNTGSELFSGQPTGGIDAVFTSPPYFDKEKYFDEPGQCWRDYPDLASWRDNYLRKTIINARRLLKEHGRMCFNVSAGLKDVVKNVAMQEGFELVEVRHITHRKDHITRARGGDAKCEPLLLFKKRGH